MQSQNINVLTRSLKFKQLGVKLQNSQNSSKFLMFFAKSQRREHCDSKIIHVILNWIAESIDSGDFLAGVMRRLCVCVWCVCVCVMCDVVNQKHFLKTGRNFQRIKALIEILLLSSLWGARSCSWTDSQPVHVSGGLWVEHEHIDSRLFGPLRARLKGILEFTMTSTRYDDEHFEKNNTWMFQKV